MKNNLYKAIVILLFILLLGMAGGSFAFGEGSFSSSAQSAVVMERSSHRILYGKNCDAHLPMASTTKIVTALTVLNNSDLDDVVEIPQSACGIEGSSIYLRAGEHLTVRELLYGLMLRSGNDAATALALHTAGSVEAFAEMMNETSVAFGCSDSNFVNPHGLHDDRHYTSARDLAVITCAALENSDFAEIVSTKTARISNEGYEYDRVLINKNKLLSAYDFADGVKTGYTRKAGRCFVGSATKNGMQVVVVVLNCGPMFEETASMLDVAFEEYRLENIVPQNKVCGMFDAGGKLCYYICADGFTYPVKEDDEISVELIADSQSGSIEVFVNGASVFTRSLHEKYIMN
ncbi:MAG: D-alanyl-D-alanine carboxypeptidase [Corallococcus sp.]|nr:D-alanyl-D-alanine carboxypeptidase [Corallococcus sp.]